jgi:hypothetical protein
MESDWNYITKYEVIFPEVHPSISFVPKYNMLDDKHIVFNTKAAAVVYIKEIIKKIRGRWEYTVINAYTKAADDYTTTSRDDVITLNVTHEKTLLLQVVITPIQILKK